MATNYNGFSKEATTEAQALFKEAVEWRTRNQAGSSTTKWDEEVTMTVSQVLARASLLVLVTAAVTAFLTANRELGGFSVPPKVAAKEKRYLDHRTRRLSPLPTEDCEALELCDKCDKWHGGTCPPQGQPTASGLAAPPSVPVPSPANSPVPVRPRGRPAGP